MTPHVRRIVEHRGRELARIITLLDCFGGCKVEHDSCEPRYVAVLIENNRRILLSIKKLSKNLRRGFAYFERSLVHSALAVRVEA